MGIETPQAPEDAGDKITIDRTLWLTAERDRVVEDGDPAAAFLYSTAGKRVPREEAEQLGALPRSSTKKAEPAEDKMAGAHEDKSTGGPLEGTPGRRTRTRGGK